MMEQFFELIMDYAERADEASLANETLQFWEYLENNCGVIGTSQGEEMVSLMNRFYVPETTQLMVERWKLGMSYLDGESGD